MFNKNRGKKKKVFKTKAPAPIKAEDLKGTIIGEWKKTPRSQPEHPDNNFPLHKGCKRVMVSDNGITRHLDIIK